ncbi:MAG: mandelate racemase [Betaproteobacteria bacterium]|jgi:mandelate racemase|nr:mandelate racemase [Betaproteobacteria bacterium]
MTADLKITKLRARGVHAPLKRPLQTATLLIRNAPFALIDLETSGGIVGRAYLFCYAAPILKSTVTLLTELGSLIEGDTLAPFDIEQKLLKRFLLAGQQGIVGTALGGIDMAAWDAMAKAAGQPLARMLGGSVRRVPAYNSNGLGLIGPERVPAEAMALIESGFRAVKLRLGYPTLVEDLAAVKAARGALPDDIELMTDYNQCLLPAEAEIRGRALDGAGLAWIEEPIRWDDYTGNASIAAALDTPVMIGESFWGVHDMAKALEAKACDYVMPDAMKIGGVSGWLRAAALAERHAMPMSSHLYPEISAHLLAVTPTAHWLEYMDWAEAFLAEPMAVQGGFAVIPDRPGTGIEWNEEAVQRYGVT